MLTRRDYVTEMSADHQFVNVMNELCTRAEGVVETGTRHGTGSTLVFAKSGVPVTTIECNPSYHRKAVVNLEKYRNVHCVLGYSLYLDDMKAFIRTDDIYDSNLSIMTDDPFTPRDYYSIELGNYLIPENVLVPLIDNPIQQLIFLDSAGGVGWLEFRKVMSLHPKKLARKILVLDDVKHVKHYRSRAELNSRFPGKFVTSDSGRWGYIDFAFFCKEPTNEPPS